MIPRMHNDNDVWADDFEWMPLPVGVFEDSYYCDIETIYVADLERDLFRLQEEPSNEECRFVCLLKRAMVPA